MFSVSKGVDFSKSSYAYDDLQKATDGFSSAHKLGEGAFGYFHGGKLANGTPIAVKTLKARTREAVKDFRDEALISSRLCHQNIINYQGHYFAGRKNLLVYEFVPNKTLEFHLHGTQQLIPYTPHPNPESLKTLKPLCQFYRTKRANNGMAGKAKDGNWMCKRTRVSP